MSQKTFRPPPKVDHYDILRVSSRATKEEITKAYRNLLKHAHPDTLKGITTKEEIARQTKTFHRIVDAKDVLLDDQKREIFDLERGRGRRLKNLEKKLASTANGNQKMAYVETGKSHHQTENYAHNGSYFFPVSKTPSRYSESKNSEFKYSERSLPRIHPTRATRDEIKGKVSNVYNPSHARRPTSNQDPRKPPSYALSEYDAYRDENLTARLPPILIAEGSVRTAQQPSQKDDSKINEEHDRLHRSESSHTNDKPTQSNYDQSSRSSRSILGQSERAHDSKPKQIGRAERSHHNELYREPTGRSRIDETVRTDREHTTRRGENISPIKPSPKISSALTAKDDQRMLKYDRNSKFPWDARLERHQELARFVYTTAVPKDADLSKRLPHITITQRCAMPKGVEALGDVCDRDFAGAIPKAATHVYDTKCKMIAEIPKGSVIATDLLPLIKYVEPAKAAIRKDDEEPGSISRSNHDPQVVGRDKELDRAHDWIRYWKDMSQYNNQQAELEKYKRKHEQPLPTNQFKLRGIFPPGTEIEQETLTSRLKIKFGGAPGYCYTCYNDTCRNCKVDGH